MSSRLITIATFTYQHEMMVLKSRLEAEDIPVFVANDLMTQVHPFYSQALGGIKVQVPEQFVDDALAIMDEAGYEIDVGKSDPDWMRSAERELAKLPFMDQVAPPWRLALLIGLAALLLFALLVIIFAI